MKIVLIAYLVLINLGLLLAMYRDKRAAERGMRRTPETTLLSLAVLGGSAGGILGMLLFRHKTRKPAFSVGFPVIFLIQAGIAWLFPQ